jgi:UDP-N-acetylmuramoylalanine--D-glutamate ligase
MPGEAHQRINAAMAVRLTQAVLGSGDEVPSCAVSALSDFSGLAHRMERLGSRRGVSVINNSMCTNPAAVVSSLNGLDGHVLLLMGGINKRLDFAPLRHYLATTDHDVLLFGTDAAELAKVLSLNGATYRTMQEAFEAATDRAAEGDTIILAPGCASTDQFRDFRHRGDVFKAIAMEWLNS